MKKSQIFIALAIVLVVALSLFLYPRMQSISDARKYSPEEYMNKK